MIRYIMKVLASIYMLWTHASTESFSVAMYSVPGQMSPEKIFHRKIWQERNLHNFLQVLKENQEIMIFKDLITNFFVTCGSEKKRSKRKRSHLAPGLFLSISGLGSTYLRDCNIGPRAHMQFGVWSIRIRIGTCVRVDTAVEYAPFFYYIICLSYYVIV